MRARKLIQRLKNVPLFPVIPLLPIGLVVSEIVFAVMNFRRLKRLETRIVRERGRGRGRPVHANSRSARVAAASA
jgi:hypothetical protein